MPNNDLGTAHGRIRIDYDGKGSAAATAALIKMQKQFEEMNQKLGRIEKALTDVDNAFDETSRAADKATKSTKDFSSSLFSANKSISSFVRDTKELVEDLNTLQRVMFLVDARARTLINTTKRLRAFGGALNDNQGNIRAFNRALRETGVYTNFFRKNLYRATQAILGTKKALAEMPAWTRTLYAFAGSMTKVATVGLILGKALDAGFIKKFAGTSIFKKIVTDSAKAGSVLEGFTKKIEKVFGSNSKIFTKFSSSTSGLKNNLKEADYALTAFTNKTSDKLSYLSRKFNSAFKPLAEFAKSARGFVLGAAIVTSGVRNIIDSFRWLGRIPKPILMALGVAISTILPAAFQVLGKSLNFASNLIAGLWDGIKQLSGGLTVIPGIMATIGAGVTSLIPVFKGLKDQFKDIFSDDPAEAFEAWAKLPEHLKPVATALRDLLPKWKELQKSAQITAFKGLGEQIKTIGNTYLPLYANGTTKVIVATRNLKDEFLKMMLTQESQGAFNNLYSNTAMIVQNLASSIRPLNEGLRDMASVGSMFLKDSSVWGPALSQRFKEWASTNKQNGNMLRWMQESRSGMYDLVKGVGDLTKGLFTLLTMFTNTSSNNWLDGFAKSMASFNKAVEKSSTVGAINKISYAVNNMKTDKIKTFGRIWDEFINMMKSVVPAVREVSQAFSNVFIPALEWAMTEIKAVAEVLRSLGIDTLIGYVLGLVASFKLIPSVLKPTWESLKILIGSILLLKNKTKMVKKVEDAFVFLAEKMAGIPIFGKKAADSIVDVGAAAARSAGLISAFAGFLTAAVAALFVFWASWQSGKDTLKAIDTQLNNSKNNLNKFRDSLREAFSDDRGTTGKNVMNSVKDGIQDMVAQAQSAADDMPGIMKHVLDIFATGGTEARDGSWGLGETKDINKLQEMAVQGELAAKGFQKLSDAGIDLSVVLTSNEASFKTSMDNFRSWGHEGNAAADQIQKLRDKIREAEQAAADAGPEAILLSEGFKKIAEAAGDTAEKFDGLKQVLEALGIIKPDAIQAAIDYNRSLADLSGTVTDIVDEFGSGDLLGKDGGFNFDTKGGQDFAQALLEVGQSYDAFIRSGKSSPEAYAQIEATLRGIEAKTGIPIEKLRELAEQAGAVRDVFGTPIEVVMGVKDEGTAALMQAYLRLKQQLETGSKEPIRIYGLGDVQKAADQINKILPGYATVDKGNLVISPEVDQAQLDIVKRALDELSRKIVVDVIPSVDPSAKPPSKPAEAPKTPRGYMPGIGGGGSGGGGDYMPGTAGKGYANYEAMEAYLDAATERTNAAVDGNQESGESFTKAFAEGISSEKSKVEKAARDVAKAAKDYMPGSPAKKGPLSGSGWSMVSGKSFSSDFAAGITKNAGVVGSAAAEVAGAAGSNLKSDKNYQAGKFLGQLSSIMDFAENAVQAFTKLTETFLSAAKFASDPLGKGTYFGKRLGFRRDPGVTDEMIRQRKADEAQQRIFQFRGSGTRPDLYDPSTGRLRTSAGVGKLVPNPDKQEIANYIVDQAMSLGYSREQANMFLTQAVGESGLKPNASNPNGWDGIFQFDKSTWDMAGGGDVMNAAQNIDNYFKLAAQRGLTAENFKDPSQLGTQVSIGGPLHPENAAKGDLTRASAAAQQFINGYQSGVGQVTDGIISGVGAIPGNLGGVLQDYGHVPSGPLARRAAAVIAARYPEISNIGGSYLPMSEGGPSKPGTHDAGMAIDISIPNWDTPQGKALGKEINAFLQSNAAELGIRYTIFDNMIQNVGEQAKDFGGSGPSGGHYDHIDIQFQDGASASVNPDGTMSFNVPRNSPFAGAQFGIPKPPEADTELVPSKDLVTLNPDGTLSAVHGTGAAPGEPPVMNAKTGKPWTPEERLAFWNLPENRMQYDRALTQEGDIGAPGVYQGTEEELAKSIEAQNPLLQGILYNTNGMPNMSTDQAIATANALQSAIDSQEIETPEGRARSSALQSSLSDLTSQNGLSENESPIDTAMAIGGAASSIAGDVFAVIDSVIESIGATKNIADTLVRGVQNTEDIYGLVDQVQSFIQLAADVAGATASITSAVGSVIPDSGTFGAGSAVAAVGQIAGLVQSALETVNAVIDLGQEAYRIVGSYFGQFLGMLTGGPEGALMGNVKFLLDEQAGQLLAYSQDNAQDKRSHDMAFQKSDLNSRNQMIGNINVYGGPGSDPRDNTRQMMFQVKASTMGQATGQ